MYNLTNLTSATTIQGIVQFANQTTGNLMMALLMISVFFIMLMVLKRWDFDRALLVSSFASFMLTILLVYAKMVNVVWALVFLIMAAFTAFYMVMSKTT
uniref:Uncharacterized protein n=1 Tax=viral metagenome TaxID=1070528 RepID=A0A6M3K0I5_9ZZZZ